MNGRLMRNYDPTLDKPAAFDLQGVNRCASLALLCLLCFSLGRRDAWAAGRERRGASACCPGPVSHNPGQQPGAPSPCP
jgi:hypothetical protein